MCVYNTHTHMYNIHLHTRNGKPGKRNAEKHRLASLKKHRFPVLNSTPVRIYTAVTPPPFLAPFLFFFPPFLLAFPLVIERERGNIPLLPARNTFPPHELPINPSWNKPINRKRRNALYPFPAKEREGECPSSILDFGSSNRRND